MHISIWIRRLISVPGMVVMLFVVAGAFTACAVSNVEATPPLAQLPTSEEARCAAEGGTWDKSNFKFTNGYCAKGSPAQCQAGGGNWHRVCMMGTLACVQPYADANKTCRSGVDCQGRRCLQAAEARGNSQSQTGRCLPNNNPCYFGINLESGQPVPTAVAD